jgi:hypothetical protein
VALCLLVILRHLGSPCQILLLTLLRPLGTAAMMSQQNKVQFRETWSQAGNYPQARVSASRPELTVRGRRGWRQSRQKCGSVISLGEHCICHRGDQTLEGNRNTSNSSMSPKNWGPRGQPGLMSSSSSEQVSQAHEERLTDRWAQPGISDV